MKAILIKELNREKIAAAITEAEGRATVRCISADGIISATNDYTKALGIPKHTMIGLRVRVDLNAQHFPRAYKYTPESTQYTMEFTSTGWKLISIDRDACKAPSRAFVAISMPEAMKAALVDRYSALSKYDI